MTFTVVVKNKNGDILTDEDLKHTTITNELYYKNMQAIENRIRKEYFLDKVHSPEITG